MAGCQVTETALPPMYHQHFSPRLRRETKKPSNLPHFINNGGEDILSPLPNCKVKISSPCGSPRIPPLRHRSYTIDSSCARPSRCSLPKDPIQPKHGSISDIHVNSEDIHTDEEEAEMEDELFIDLPPIRSRSLTCPDSINSRRRLKVRSQRRPSTPPPEDLCTTIKNMAVPSDVDKQIDDILVRFKES